MTSTDEPTPATIATLAADAIRELIGTGAEYRAVDRAVYAHAPHDGIARDQLVSAVDELLRTGYITVTPVGDPDPAAYLAEVTRLRAELAEEESVCRERGHWLAQVDAALTAAGQDEGGGYIAYARRITDVAAERDRLRAADAAVLAVMAHYRDVPDDASRWAILSDLAIARDGHIPEHLATTPACSCAAEPVHQAGCPGGA